MIINLHRDRIIRAMSGSTSQTGQEIAESVLDLYDKGLLRIEFDQYGELIISLRDDVVDTDEFSKMEKSENHDS